MMAHEHTFINKCQTNTNLKMSCFREEKGRPIVYMEGDLGRGSEGGEERRGSGPLHPSSLSWLRSLKVDQPLKASAAGHSSLQGFNHL